jgi:hypothetical protein
MDKLLSDGAAALIPCSSASLAEDLPVVAQRI